MTGNTFTAANDYIVISGTSFANADAMINAIATGGSFVITGGTGTNAFTGGSIVVVWTDGDSSYVSVVEAALANGTSTGGAIVVAAATGTDVTLAQLSGVDRSALENWVVTNIDFQV